MADAIIADLASRSQYHELVRVAEEADMKTSPNQQFNTSPLILSYLILDNIPPAQHVLARLPDALAALPLNKALASLVAATADRQYIRIYSRAEALLNLVSQPDFFDRKLASVIADLVTKFVETFRQRTFHLLSKAYSSLPLSLAATYLGFPGEQIIDVASRYSWSYDAETQVLQPKPILNVVAIESTQTTSSLSTFRFIADTVGELET